MKNQDIWSSFEYEPRFHLLSIVPEQKKIITYEIKNDIFYFNNNPYGEKKQYLIDNIELNNDGIKLYIQNKKPIKLTIKNSINSILIDFLLVLKDKNLKTILSDQDHIQLMFLNNILYCLDIKKYTNNTIINHLTFVLVNNKLYVDFNGPRFLIKKINSINNKIYFETEFEVFMYQLNNQNLINTYLNKMINESANLKMIQATKYDNNNQPHKLLNNNCNYYQIQYNPCFNYIFLSNNKTTFFYSIKKNEILFCSNELGINNFTLITTLKPNQNNELFIKLNNNKVVIYKIQNDIDKIICEFLSTLRTLDITNIYSMSKFMLCLSNDTLTQFRIYNISNDQHLINGIFQIFANDKNVICRINEIDNKEITDVDIINSTIIVSTKKSKLKFDFFTHPLISNFLKKILKNHIRLCS